ncbi:MAG: MlaA family lipoprotein, partial [Enterobacteriaceae bacterium]
MKKWVISALISSTVLTGCASKNKETTQRSDPLEGFNRAMFSFNYNVLDPYVVRPVAVGWRDYMPQPARNGLTNFFTNLSEPASMANSFMVGDVYVGMKHFTRFFLNSVLGIGGLIDVAGMANPQQLSNPGQRQFGSTLANYHVGYGPYMVLPFYGSFTLREEGGGVVDDLYPPLSWLTSWMYVGKWTLEGVETRARFLDSENLLFNSPDPY